MAKEFRENFVGLVTLVVVALAIFGIVKLGTPATNASSINTSASQPTDLGAADEHLFAAVYTTTEGQTSTLGLNNSQNHPMTAQVTLYNKHGQALAIPPITLGAHQNHGFDIANWVHGAGGGFEEGSLEVFYQGPSMAMGAQETITDANHSLSYDVHLQEPMDFKSSRADGLWWALEDEHTEAEVFIANTRATQTTVTPIFYIHGAAHQGDAIILNGHESDVIDIGKSLQKLHLATPAIGGISLTYTSMGGVAMVGIIRNKQTGFSTTMRFIDQEGQHTTTLHGASVLIGRPEVTLGFSATTRFTPHVFVRNNTNHSVQINPRIRYTLFDQPNTVSFPTSTLSANEVRELNLSSAINAIGNNVVADAGIEIDHGGSPGAVTAYAASIDQSGSNVFDVPIKDPKSEMGFKGGSYPWNIDGDNRAVLHVKNVDVPGDAKKREFMVKLYFDGGEYYLPLQSLEAGQTMEVDIKKLRDDQIRDDLGNVIPLTTESGQLNWYGRAKKGEFIGRLVQYDPANGISSSFSCLFSCQCDLSFGTSWLTPSSFEGGVGDSFTVNAWEEDIDCNGFPFLPYRVPGVPFNTTNPFVVDVPANTAVLTGGGSAYIIGVWDTYFVTERPDPTCEIDIGEGPCPHVCDSQLTTASGVTSVTVPSVRISGPQAVQDGSFIDPIFVLTPVAGTPTGYQWSWSAPAGVGDNPLVTFTPSNAAMTVTNRHWFANPNVACPSPPAVSNPPVATDPYYNSVYGIRGQATFSSGVTAHADTTLTINAFWNPAGQTPPPTITGGPTIDFNPTSNLWFVVDSGSIKRVAPTPTIFVPVNSQFYNKTLVHENRHVQQYVSGMNSDLFTVDSLMAVLSPLTDPTQAGLTAKISQAFSDWLSSQNTLVIIRTRVMEADAYSISDNVLP